MTKTKNRPGVADLAALTKRLEAIEADVRKIKDEWPTMLQGFATAYQVGVAQIDVNSEALKKTIERVEVLENTIRGLDLHGGEPGPSGEPMTRQ